VHALARSGRLSRRKKIGSVIATVAGAAAIAALPASASGADGSHAVGPIPLPGLCGIAEPIDRLLACPIPAGGADRPAPPIPRYVSNRLLVKFKRSARPRDIRVLLATAGLKAKRAIPHLGLRVLRVAPDERDQAFAYLRSSNLVARAERDLIYARLDTAPNDNYWSEQWGLRTIRLPTAWDATRGSVNVLVAVLDTGIEGAHPDLAGEVLPAGHDFVNGDSDPADDEGHGTAVAGVIGAVTNNGKGQAGACWTCTLLAEKVLNASGEGDTVKIALGLIDAVDSGARIVNMSLGGPGESQTLANAVSYAIGKGVVLVAAAGNSGTSAPFYPAAYPGVIAVAASDQSDHLYDWSNYGSWVGVAAPGCNVATLRGGGYGNFCGTSSAAPIVSGLAALALAANPGATGNDILQAIERGVVPIGGSVLYGRVDAPKTLAAMGVTPPPASGSPGPSTSRPSAPAEAATSTATFRGTLTLKAPVRTYRRSVASGRIEAKLSFRGARRLTLVVVNGRGARIARVVGRTPLRLLLKVRRATYRFVVAGRGRRIPFKLVVSYSAPTTSQKQ
jgi:subtilisin family serine protease